MLHYYHVDVIVLVLFVVVFCFDVVLESFKIFKTNLTTATLLLTILLNINLIGWFLLLALLLCKVCSNLLSQHNKSLLNISGGFCRSFEEGNAKLLCICLCSFCLNLSTADQIALVAHQEALHSWRCALFNLCEPNFDVLECLGFCHIINNDDTMSTAVICGSDGTETILACCVIRVGVGGFFVSFCFVVFLLCGRKWLCRCFYVVIKRELHSYFVN